MRFKLMAGSSTFSLRTRLLTWLLGPLLLIGLFALWDARHSARDTADEISDRLLAGSVLAIAEQVFVNDDGELEVDVPYVALQMLTSSADDRVFYRIETLEGKFVTGYRQLNLQNAPQSQPNKTQFFDGVFRGTAIRIATFEGAASSSTTSLGYRVGVAETTNARVATAEQILLRSALRQGVLIVAAALLVWIAVTNALKPLSNLKRAIDRRNPDDMRPIKHKVPLEVEGVVERINELLARFSSSIDALRNFTANTSHQFRTPLALIRTHLELAQRAETHEEKIHSIHNANKAVGDAERLMGQMLLLSRINAMSTGALTNETCDLTSIAKEVCEEFVLRFSTRTNDEIDLGFTAEDSVQVKADKTLVQEVVRNLVDNAVKHGGSATKLDVSVKQDAETGLVEVRDYGAGFDIQTVIGDADPANKSNPLSRSQGTGIGLIIVREIVDLFGGEIAAEKATPAPGMLLTISFPLR